ncbi:hypothetical protein LPB73_07685 [Tardiphaga sp. 37S4]|uniref:hypothetical protein n=1 Tax=Tardiphaga sp. 37S4 TaxID=1404741 RepID=UPI001E3D8029|nr:hypothetical protein [Tardiphaga sp. 37S4]UFS77249.1 hypothetical protein LPB73_07685 [Tardiphaga sp. 37S4]
MEIWLAVIIATIPGTFGKKPFVRELDSKYSSYEQCSHLGGMVARLGGVADIDPDYKIYCRKVG